MASLQDHPRILIALAAATAALACVCAVLNAVGGEVLRATIWGVLAALNVVNVILRIRKLKKSREDTFDEQKTV